MKIIHQSEPFNELKTKKGAIGYYMINTQDNDKVHAYFHARVNSKTTTRKGKIKTRSLLCIDRQTGEAPFSLVEVEIIKPMTLAKRGRKTH